MLARIRAGLARRSLESYLGYFAFSGGFGSRVLRVYLEKSMQLPSYKVNLSSRSEKVHY
jgi:hypothetical protein